MFARPLEAVQEVLLGRRGGVRCTLQQDQPAFDPEQLREASAFFVALRPRERLVDGFEALRDLPGMAERLRTSSTGFGSPTAISR